MVAGAGIERLRRGLVDGLDLPLGPGGRWIKSPMSGKDGRIISVSQSCLAGFRLAG
jgi:hypothetical protein